MHLRDSPARRTPRRVRTGGAASAAGHPLGHVRRLLRALLAAALLCAALAVGAYEALPAGNSPVPRRFGQAGLLSLPVAAQGVASGALGAQNPAYRVHAVAGGGFSVASSTHGLQSAFDATGVSVTAGGAHVRLRLLGAGFGHGPPAGPSGPAACRREPCRLLAPRSGRVVRQRTTRTRAGLHAGAPAWRPAGPAPSRWRSACPGTSASHSPANGRTVELTHDGRRVMRYTGLSASGAGGHALRSWLSLDGRRILLHLETRGARFPVRVDPLVQEEKLLRRRRGRRRPSRRDRRAVLRRQHRARRRAQRQRVPGRRVRVHPHGLGLESAGPARW